MMQKLLNNPKQTEKRPEKGVFPMRIIVIAVFLLVITAAMILFCIHYNGKRTYRYTPDTKIILYHLINDEVYGPNDYLFVKEADFEEQLKILQKEGLIEVENLIRACLYLAYRHPAVRVTVIVAGA